MGCHWLTPIAKKEDKFRTRAYQMNLFCHHLTEVYSELPSPSHLKCRIQWPVQEWMLQENQICTCWYHLQTCNEKQWRLITSESGQVYKMKKMGPRTEPWGTHQLEAKEMILFHLQLLLAGRNQRTKQDHIYQKCFWGESEGCYSVDGST